MKKKIKQIIELAGELWQESTNLSDREEELLLEIENSALRLLEEIENHD